MGRPIRNLNGQRFGYWEVVEFAFISKTNRSAYWRCKCTLCDKEYFVRSDALAREKSTKCRTCADRMRRRRQ